MITLSIKEQKKTETISLHLKVRPETKHQFELVSKKLNYRHGGQLLDELIGQMYQQAFKDKNNASINQ